MQTNTIAPTIEIVKQHISDVRRYAGRAGAVDRRGSDGAVGGRADRGGQRGLPAMEDRRRLHAREEADEPGQADREIEDQNRAEEEAGGNEGADDHQQKRDESHEPRVPVGVQLEELAAAQQDDEVGQVHDVYGGFRLGIEHFIEEVARGGRDGEVQNPTRETGPAGSPGVGAAQRGGRDGDGEDAPIALHGDGREHVRKCQQEQRDV